MFPGHNTYHFPLTSLRASLPFSFFLASPHLSDLQTSKCPNNETSDFFSFLLSSPSNLTQSNKCQYPLYAKDSQIKTSHPDFLQIVVSQFHLLLSNLQLDITRASPMQPIQTLVFLLQSFPSSSMMSFQLLRQKSQEGCKSQPTHPIKP